MRFGALALLLCFLPLAVMAQIRGGVRVLDGDSIEIQGVRMDLDGIDAPEPGQRCQKKDDRDYDCGELATRALRTIIGGRRATCDAVGRTTEGLPLARCRLGRRDLAREMIAMGWALAPEGAPAGYSEAQSAAEAKGEGLWVGRFIPPWEWREGKRLVEATPPAPAPAPPVTVARAPAPERRTPPRRETPPPAPSPPPPAAAVDSTPPAPVREETTPPPPTREEVAAPPRQPAKVVEEAKAPPPAAPPPAAPPQPAPAPAAETAKATAPAAAKIEPKPKPKAKARPAPQPTEAKAPRRTARRGANRHPVGCPIKGNIDAIGRRYYYLPNNKWYAIISVNPEAGERWFCTEKEALAAGWRKFP